MRLRRRVWGSMPRRPSEAPCASWPASGSPAAGSASMRRCVGIGRMREPRGRRERAGPGLQAGIEAADHEERQLREEFAVLIGHVVADHARARGLHAFAPAGLGLQRALAGVEGRGDHDAAVREADRRAHHRHEAGQGLHAREPGAHMRIRIERHAAFGRMRHVGVVRNVGQRGGRAGQEGQLRQVNLHHREQRVRARRGFAGVGAAEQRHDARRRGAIGQRPGRHREPALHARRAHRVARHPAGRIGRVALVEVDKDRVRIGQRDLAVLDHRNLAEGVARQELGRAVRALLEVELDALEGQAQHREKQAHPVHVARDGAAVELDGLCGKAGDCVHREVLFGMVDGVSRILLSCGK